MRAAILVAAVMTACQADDLQTVEDVPGPDRIAREKAMCEARGGRWGPGGKGALVCYTLTKDANRSCSQQSECEGLCLARSRTCTPVTPVFGCNEILLAGGTQATLCRD